MSQAIETKVLPATEHRPTRIQATCSRGKRVMSVHTLPDDGLPTGILNHRSAAHSLIEVFQEQDTISHRLSPRESEKASWLYRSMMVTGQLRNGNYVHIIVGVCNA